MSASIRFVCRDCVTEAYLKSQAFKDEKIHRCSYCKGSNKALSLEDFSEIIYEAIQAYHLSANLQSVAFNRE